MNVRPLLTACLALLCFAAAWGAQAQPAPAGYPAYPSISPRVDQNPRWAFITDLIADLDAAKATGVQVVTGGTNASGPGMCGGPYGLALDGKTIINTSTGKPLPLETGEPGQPSIQEIRALVDAAHARGFIVLGELMRLWNNQVLLVDHPEWQEIKKDGDAPLGPDKMTAWPPVTGCWNSPFGDHYIKTSVELARVFDWDGYNLDGFGCWTICHCTFCKESYKQETGHDIPYASDTNDPAFRRHLKWRLQKFSAWCAKWQAALKQVKPDFIAAPWSTGPGRWWHWSFAPLAESSDYANRVMDAPMVELFWDFPPDQGSNLMPSFVSRYYRGLAGDRPAVLLPYYCTQGQINMQPPQVECDFRTFTILTNGNIAMQANWQKTPQAGMEHYFKLIQEREEYTKGAKSTKWAAMLVGESSRLLYGLPGKRSEVGIGNWIGSGVDTPDISTLPPGERRLPQHMESAVGTFRAMMEEQLPLDIITEADVDTPGTLEQYKVLILPNTACLSERQMATIRSFVDAGGGLVAMQEASLCDEFGTRRANYGLADLFQANFKATEDFSARWPNYPAVTYVSRTTESEITHGPKIESNLRVGTTELNFIGWTTVNEPAPGARVLATRGSAVANGAVPFLITNEANAGRVAYFAADIGQAYFLAPYQYERAMLVNAIHWAARGQQPPVTVAAPMAVQAGFYHQNEGARQVVHLLNQINTNGSSALPENNSSMREEVVAIAGIKVTFADRSYTRFKLVPEGIELTAEETPAGKQVTLPALGLHSMVVAER